MYLLTEILAELSEKYNSMMTVMKEDMTRISSVLKNRIV